MGWYFHLFQNFPVCWISHKGFSVVNEAEVDDFLELSCFFNDPTDVGNLISGFSAFSNQVELLEVHGSCAVETWLGVF